MEALIKTNAGLKIVDCTPEYEPYFKSLNLAWIKKYFAVEDIDEKVLSFPDEYIYKDGGTILMALLDGKVVGTVALKSAGEASLELTKMAVDEAVQGAQIGYHLCVAAIEKAKELGAKCLVLYSQTRLIPAIKLYKKLGFKEVALEPGKYQRCNIKMKISFKEQEVIGALSSRFRKVLEDSKKAFDAIPEVKWHQKPELKRWSRKEILGHLIDSASNNHQRFVRIQHVEDRNFPGYDQDHWVGIQNYQNEPVSGLLNLWYYYNLHLCHVVANLHFDMLYTICTRGNSEPISFHDLIIDYIEHLEHHVGQILMERA